MFIVALVLFVVPLPCARGRLLLRPATRGAACVLVPAEPARRDAAALGIQARRLPFGISAARWPPAAPVPRQTGAHARLIHVASLNAVKDQTLLLRALRRLRDDGVPFHLDIAGVDTLQGAVQRTARELDLSGCVTFHGFLTRDQLRPVLARSHVLLMSSRHETGPIAALEAALLGVPTVGTHVGHLAEWAPDAAVTVPDRNADALAAAVAALLRDEPRRLAIAAAAQRRALSEDVSFTARSLEATMRTARAIG